MLGLQVAGVQAAVTHLRGRRRLTTPSLPGSPCQPRARAGRIGPLPHRSPSFSSGSPALPRVQVTTKLQVVAGPRCLTEAWTPPPGHGDPSEPSGPPKGTRHLRTDIGTARLTLRPFSRFVQEKCA